MTAEFIARALCGRKAGFAGMALCPAHEDREPSLAIADDEDGTVLVHCHAGCGQHDVIKALRARGLWGRTNRHVSPVRRKLNCGSRRSAPNRNAENRAQAALTIWRASELPRGTPVETYLRSRGLAIPVLPSIRCHARLKHPLGSVWPSMVALVQDVDGMPIGIHRTFLAHDGTRKAPVKPAKMMLGSVLRRRGAARPAEGCADGWRRYRDMPCRNEGERSCRMGSTLDPEPSRS
jgi:putative DNA primase/helicase